MGFGGCGKFTIAAAAEQFLKGLAFDTIGLALVHVGENDGLQGTLFHPATNGCIVDTKNFSNFRHCQ